jgi:hypothetical protein
MNGKQNPKAAVQAARPGARCKKLATGGYVVKGITTVPRGTITIAPSARSPIAAWKNAEEQLK